jgi:hypothetical protein
VSVGVEAHHGASEEVKLDCELSGHVSVDLGQHLVASQEVLSIILEVPYRKEFLV